MNVLSSNLSYLNLILFNLLIIIHSIPTYLHVNYLIQFLFKIIIHRFQSFFIYLINLYYLFDLILNFIIQINFILHHFILHHFHLLITLNFHHFQIIKLFLKFI